MPRPFNRIANTPVRAGRAVPTLDADPTASRRVSENVFLPRNTDFQTVATNGSQFGSDFIKEPWLQVAGNDLDRRSQFLKFVLKQIRAQVA